MRRKILPPSFFARPTARVARDLLGKFLVRRRGKKEIAAKIIEVEAYDGFSDRGSHASRGRTSRNAPMFGPPGRSYVYFTYGMHWMLNIVTGKRGYPAAVLIRGVEGVAGPGRVTKRFGITKRENNLPVSPKSGLWLEDRGLKVLARKIKKGPRVGIQYAGPYWVKRHLRFWIAG